MSEAKLTKNELFWLGELAKAMSPVQWKRKLKTIGNKFVRLGLAASYPAGFYITQAGRQHHALADGGRDG